MAVLSVPLVTIIVLNWNGWRDTITCLESVLELQYPARTVIVCDNGSTDGSIGHIELWAQGAQTSDATHQGLRPLRWLSVDRASLEESFDKAAWVNADLVIVRNGANLGFAAGNNVGIRAALRHSNAEFIWLLNNDTQVAADALSELVARMRAVASCGLCGSALVDQHDALRIQALAGTYSPWVARTTPIAAGARATQQFDDNQVSNQADYVIGASMLLSRSLLETVGLLSEDYFLYFEELDLIYRARGRFTFACASRSRVRHQWGASINPAHEGRVSAVSDYYFSRARILFTRRHFTRALPTVVPAVLSSALVRLWRRQPRNAAAVLRGLIDGLRGRTGAMA